MNTYYDRAHDRMEVMKFTDEEMKFIFSDWNEGDEHYKWLLRATRVEIQDWIDAATK